MITLDEFGRELRKLASPQGRPFVCDGSPINSSVFLVGANPASAMSRPFWDFWSDTKGFDKDRWYKQYLIDRANAPLKLGKTRRNTISNTRKRLNWIVEEASPAGCLETNVYSEPTEALPDLSVGQRVTSIFEFLFASIKPKLLVPHGKDARECIETWCGRSISEGKLSTRTVLGIEVKVLSVSHFSRGWSQDAARELGYRIREIVFDPDT